MLGHGRDLLKTLGIAIDGAVLGVERLAQDRPAPVDVAHPVVIGDAHNLLQMAHLFVIAFEQRAIMIAHHRLIAVGDGS